MRFYMLTNEWGFFTRARRKGEWKKIKQIENEKKKMKKITTHKQRRNQIKKKRKETEHKCNLPVVDCTVGQRLCLFVCLFELPGGFGDEGKVKVKNI